MSAARLPQAEGRCFLRGRRILVISPQPWDHLHISKHHYAEELAAENEVVFLEPPGDASLLPSLSLREHPSLKSLKTASWRPFTPKALRFHAYPAYRAAMRHNAAWLARRLGNPDVVWCFDFNVFPDLKAFGATVKLFHPVDPLSSPAQVAIGTSADLVISVSERILSNFEATVPSERRLLVNHGLAGAFADLATRPVPPRRPGPIRCGFFGNLDRPVIDIERLRDLAADRSDVEFHFWGPYSDGSRFAGELAPLANVHAHGRTEKAALAEAVEEMDLFVLAYVDHPTESDRSNAHKLLEYMSTGKTIVATRMDCYDDDPDLLRISREPSDRDFAAVFSETVAAIKSWNSPARVAKRKAFCRQFTYAANIDKINAALLGLAEHQRPR